MKPTDMLHQMCHTVFAGTDVKAVCKARGFPSQAASSRGVLETLFLSSQGLGKVFDSLERKEIALLHLLKTTGPVDVSFFGRVYSGSYSNGTFSQRFQTAFTKAKQRLVRNGVLLLAAESQPISEKTSKMERWRFSLPAEFHEHLPPLIQSPRQLTGEGTWNSNVGRDQLIADLGRSRKSSADAVFQIQEGQLHLSGERFEAKKLAGWQQSGWNQAVRGGKGSNTKDSYSKRPDEAVLCILAELPDRHWADAEQLAEPMQVFCGKKKMDSAAVCDSGVEWGLLASHRADGKPAYRLAPNQPDPVPHDYLTADGPGGSVVVDLTTVPFAALENIVAVSDQRVDSVRKSTLLITPNFVKLGRADDNLLAAEPVAWLVEHTQPFAEAYVALGERRGKTILHENVCVARISDLSLKVAVEKALGSNLVSLQNDFIAFPKGSLGEVRRVVKKSGHVVKEVSAK